MSSTVFSSEEKIWRGPERPTPLFSDKANLGRVILHIMSREPHKVAQISDNNGIRMTNSEIVSNTEKIAGGLRRRGCQRGDVVGFVARNGHNLSPSLYAAFLLEAPTHAMDVNQDENEIFAMFKITKPRFIFCDDDKVTLVQNVVKRLGREVTIIVYGRKMQNNVHIEDLMREGDNDELRKKINEESCRESEIKYHIIVCSSGTTGPQKAVCIPYQELIAPDWPQRICTTPTDSLFSFCPIFWSVAYIVILKCVFYGFTRIITTEPFNPELFIHIVNKYKVTHTVISPLYLDRVLDSPKFTSSSLSAMKNIWVGGNLVTEAVARKLLPYIDRKEFEISYGMSEIGAISAYMYDPMRPVSVGILLDGIEGIVVDEEGKRLGPNETGELCFKSFYHLTEYLDNPEATAAFTDHQGFMHTGDVGFYDDDHYLHIVGRCKDTIKYLMSHVSGTEIEKTVMSLPGISQVVAVGIHDPVFNQLPAVVVVKKEGASFTEEEIFKQVDENLPDSHKLRGGVYFVDKLPFTITGKLKRIEVEKLAEERYHLLSPK